MSLRFFGRQRVTDEEKDPPADEVPSTTRALERSRTSGAARRAARARKARTQQPAKPLPVATPQPTPAEAPSRERRRRPSAPEAPPKTPAPEAPAPPSVDVSGLESVLAQQGKLLQDFASKQLTVMRTVQRSLSAVEKRLAPPQPVEAQVPLPRVGIFVDVPNVMYAAERQGLVIDYARLLAFLSRGRELVRASAYAPISDDPQAKIESQKFVQPFVDRGYRIVTKPLKRYADGSIKANFDVELAIDILTMSDRLDIVSLVSGDGDFRRLVELVASRGVRVEVVAFAQSMSHELRAIADQCVEIGEHLSELRAK